MVRFSTSKVFYATHQLSIYHGECPHNCDYCFNQIFRNRGWKWAVGDLRVNKKALALAKEASKEGVECLVLSFTNDPLPYFKDEEKQEEVLQRLLAILDVLEKRKINTKVLTKNPLISLLRLERKPYKHVKIGLTVTTNESNNAVARKYESGSHGTVSDKLATLLILKECGFLTWGSGEPPLPGTNIETWLNEILSTGVSELWVGRGNYKAYLSNAFNWYEFTEEVLRIKKEHERGQVIKLKPELDKYRKRTNNQSLLVYASKA